MRARSVSTDMGEKIYFDTNQLYYIRRIAEEAEGWEYGDYSWAYRLFPDNPQMIADIRALCYIVALQYQWDLEFCSSDASYIELCHSVGDRAIRTREAWEIISETHTDKKLGMLPLESNVNKVELDMKTGKDRLRFISDKADRGIVRDFIDQGADVLLTSDGDILRHKVELTELGIRVMRPAEWLNDFLKDMKGDEDGVDWVERILFTVGQK